MPINVVDFIAKGFLAFTNETVVILFIMFGFLSFKRDIFGKALFILLFSLIFNPFLKSLWQIPLPSSIGPGWSFPSGHLQNTFVLWGWLILELRKPLFSGFAVVLLSGIAFSLIHYGFHTPKDIVGALFFGIIILIAYYYFLKLSWIKKHIPLIGIIFALLTIPFILGNPRFLPSNWIAEGGLVGFSVGWVLLEKYLSKKAINHNLSIKRRIALIIFALIGTFLIKTGFSHLHVPFSKHLSLFTYSLSLGLWISFGSSYIFQKLTPSEN